MDLPSYLMMRMMRLDIEEKEMSHDRWTSHMGVGGSKQLNLGLDMLRDEHTVLLSIRTHFLPDFA